MRITVIEAARVCGANRRQALWHVMFPLARRGIGAGIIFSFAHIAGESGVVLMPDGSIPGVTKLASISLYDEVQNSTATNLTPSHSSS